MPDDITVLAPRSLGEALRTLRHRARRARDEVSGLTGVSAGAISNYENDVTIPSALILRRLCVTFADLLECDPGELWQELGAVLDQAVAVENRQRPGTTGGITPATVPTEDGTTPGTD